MINTCKEDNMGWDQTWQLRTKRVRVDDLRAVAQRIAREYVGVEVNVEQEASDCLTVFFTVPQEEEAPPATVEVSLYEMGNGRHILSLEADAADNNTCWEDAGQLADDLAEDLGATPLDLATKHSEAERGHQPVTLGSSHHPWPGLSEQCLEGDRTHTSAPLRPFLLGYEVGGHGL